MANQLRRLFPRFETLEAREVLTAYMGVELRATDLAGNVITSVAAGQAFNLQVLVDDMRPITDPPANDVEGDGDEYYSGAYGVFSAFVDVLYEGSAFDYDSVTGVRSGSGSPSLASASYDAASSSDGDLERVGTFQTATALGNGNQRLWVTIPMIAESQLGEFTISAQHPVTNETFPNTPEGNTARRQFINQNASALLYGGAALNPDEVDYSKATITLNIIEPGDPVELDLRIVKTPTAVNGSGEVSMLPDNVQWLDEWDNFYVEIYAQAPEGATLTSVTVTIAFTNSFHNAVTFYDVTNDSSLKFTASNKVYNNNTNYVTVTYSTPFTGLGDNGASALLGRIYFGPDLKAGSGVANDATGDYPDPVDSTFTVSSGGATVQYSSSSEPTGVTIGSSATTDLWAVPYDLDDDGAITLLDLTNVIRKIGSTVTPSNDLYRLDFTQDGTVDLIDMTMLIKNIGISASNASVSPRRYYSGFPFYPVGSMNLMEGESVDFSSSSFVLEGESITVEDSMVSSSATTPAPATTYFPMAVVSPTTSSTSESKSSTTEQDASGDETPITDFAASGDDAESMMIADAAASSLANDSTADSDAVDEVFADLESDDLHLTM
ncbi:dockerin type I domain-containing protein [Blastopirellula marina]|uniref:Dockerin domain-containing protein n=1 Tax=Blastopirellula marina TaxID=124 RepID=A0A2S8GK61_9BACT|nr:dockerin type I domain-containing protein [Blastopirellula marina]PQO44701.1 hypothetical protein C5Y93_18225 [Blastopirellula marina]